MEGFIRGDPSPSQESRRKKAGKPSVKILQQDRHLINSITADWNKTEAVAGTNVVYAAPTSWC